MKRLNGVKVGHETVKWCEVWVIKKVWWNGVKVGHETVEWCEGGSCTGGMV